MNSANEDEESVPDLSEVIANIVGRARASGYQDGLKELSATSILDAIAATAVRTDDYNTVIAVIQQSIQDVEKWKITLQEMLRQVEELEASRARQVQYSERWWQWKRKTLYEALQNDQQEGLCQWLRTYAKALIAWELGMCEKLANEPFPFPPQAVDVPTLFQKGTQAITDENDQQALDMLAYLTKATSTSQPDYILKKGERATLLVFMGRIFLYKTSDSEAALNLFEQAQKMAPEIGRPYAALGEYYRLKNEHEKAMGFYKQAIELSSKQPDGYIGKGLLYEDQELWDEADDCYEEAMEAVREGRDIEVALNKLSAPVSGNVFLQLARVYKKKQDPERALQAVTRAISMGIKDQGEYPERIGYRLKGEILELLERRTEAAQAHFEAGRRFNWRSESKLAVEILTHAKELNPSYVPIYWQLSDALRMSSYQTTPPYVDQELIKRSLATWEQGYTIELPSSVYYWVYFARAMINEQLARLPNADQWALWWEAIAYLERFMLLNKTDHQYWSFLGRYYRYLETEANALQATSKAIDHDPTDLNALDERVAILANVGEFDAAEEVIAKRQKLEVSTWIDAVQAYILIHKDSYKKALEILQRVLQTEPDELWYHGLRGLCYLMLDEPQRAKEDYEWNWNHYNESDSNNWGEYGWAAYNLGKIDEAIEIFNKKRNDPIGVGNTYWNLGLCYLTRGDLPLGEENLERGIARLRSVRELDGLLKQDLYIIEKSSASWLHGAQVREVLARIKEKIKARRDQVMRRNSAEEELKEVIRRYPREEGKINWSWIGAQAGLARFCIEEERWSEAAEKYMLLQKEGERFPEALIRLEEALDRLQEEGDVRLREGKPNEALEQLLQMSKLELLSDDKTRLAQLYSRLGYVYFDLADSENARRNFTKALQFYHENDTSSPGSALGEICRSLLRDATHYWALDDGWKGMANEVSSDEMLRSDLAFARMALENYLDEFYKLSEQYVDRNALLPVATPIRLEIGEGLVNRRQEWQEWPLFKSYIPEMRQWFQDEMGVVVPGIRVLENDALSSDGYMIMLDEAEIERGRVYLDMRYCPVLSQTLEALGVPKAALIEQPQPMTGEPGCWIPRDSWDLVINNNLELWAEPLVYIIYHLEAVLLKNLSDFLGVQEVESLLAEWEKRDDASPLAASTLSDQRARYHFAQVLRALVSEQVPITSCKDILEAFQESGPLDADVNQAVRVIRLRLKRQLPGNSPNAQRLDLPLGWEDKLIAGLGHKNGRVTFAVPAEEIYKFLLVMRNAVGFREWNLVLVTRSSELRPFIRRLVEHEFPHLMVLSQEELLTQEELMEIDQEAVVEQAKGVVADEQ